VGGNLGGHPHPPHPPSCHPTPTPMLTPNAPRPTPTPHAHTPRPRPTLWQPSTSYAHLGLVGCIPHVGWMRIHILRVASETFWLLDVSCNILCLASSVGGCSMEDARKRCVATTKPHDHVHTPCMCARRRSARAPSAPSPPSWGLQSRCRPTPNPYSPCPRLRPHPMHACTRAGAGLGRHRRLHPRPGVCGAPAAPHVAPDAAVPAAGGARPARRVHRPQVRHTISHSTHMCYFVLYMRLPLPIHATYYFYRRNT
jgi:hypothetical protein